MAKPIQDCKVINFQLKKKGKKMIKVKMRESCASFYYNRAIYLW